MNGDSKFEIRNQKSERGERGVRGLEWGTSKSNEPRASRVTFVEFLIRQRTDLSLGTVSIFEFPVLPRNSRPPRFPPSDF